MLTELFQLSGILASSFWFTDILLLAITRGRRWKVLALYVTFWILAFFLYQISARPSGIPLAQALFGTLSEFILIIAAAVPFWYISRVRGMQSALALGKPTRGRAPKSTDIRKTAELIEKINITTLGFTLSILVGSLLASAVGNYSVPVIVIFVVVLSIVFVWSATSSHLATDEAKLRIQFIAFILLVTAFSVCLAVILVSYMFFHGVVLAAAATITAIISPVPFLYVEFLDRIKDRLFPTGTSRRTLALSMIALHQRAIMILLAETIVLSDVPTAIMIFSSGNTSTLFTWVESFMIFVSVMIFHFTRNTYSYLAMGRLVTVRDIEKEIAKAMRRSVRFR